MNRYKCPTCGRNQYTACGTAEGCIYCGHKELSKMETFKHGGPLLCPECHEVVERVD